MRPTLSSITKIYSKFWSFHYCPTLIYSFHLEKWGTFYSIAHYLFSIPSHPIVSLALDTARNDSSCSPLTIPCLKLHWKFSQSLFCLEDSYPISLYPIQQAWLSCQYNFLRRDFTLSHRSIFYRLIWYYVLSLSYLSLKLKFLSISLPWEIIHFTRAKAMFILLTALSHKSREYLA